MSLITTVDISSKGKILDLPTKDKIEELHIEASALFNREFVVRKAIAELDLSCLNDSLLSRKQDLATKCINTLIKHTHRRVLSIMFLQILYRMSESKYDMVKSIEFEGVSETKRSSNILLVNKDYFDGEIAGFGKSKILYHVSAHSLAKTLGLKLFKVMATIEFERADNSEDSYFRPSVKTIVPIVMLHGVSSSDMIEVDSDVLTHACIFDFYNWTMSEEIQKETEELFKGSDSDGKVTRSFEMLAFMKV